jgi:lipopolysaccharide biosynthesis protein
MALKFRRIYTQVTADILPGLLRKFGRKPFQPIGRERPASDEWSMVVPFSYDVPKHDLNTAVICHIFHADLAEEIFFYLSRSQLQADIFISTDTEEKAQKIRGAFDDWRSGTTIVRVVENRGRDIAPKLITFSEVFDRYQLLLFLHSKRSGHYDFGDGWREYLFKSLVGSSETIRSIQEVFALRPEVGMIAPPHYPALREAANLHWAFNFRKSRRLGWKMDVDIEENGILDFPAGSMFWARPAAMKPMLRLKSTFSDFAEEPCKVDGTLAHCMERLFFYSCESAGFYWVKIVDQDFAPSEQPRMIIGAPAQIGDFIARHRFNLVGAHPH